MIYDRTCTGSVWRPGLTHSWIAGAYLYGGLKRLDAWFGASSWEEALSFLATCGGSRKIREIQFWGHGNWGNAKIDGEKLSIESLAASHAHAPLLGRVRDRLDDDALWWFRTCETFGTETGHRFAEAFADYTNARVAGHTYVIWCLQSGLHSIRPGVRPNWSPDEGLPVGDASPTHALWSTPSSPNTVSFLTGRIPEGY